MAPELFPEDESDVDQLFTLSSDIYALGMLAFEVHESLGTVSPFRLLITTDRCSQIQCRLMQWGLSRRSGSWPVCMQERDRLAYLTRNIAYRMPCGRSCKPVGLQIPRQGQRRQCLCSGSVSFSPFHVLMMLCARSAYLGSRY
jgi:hypothetical protein